MMIRESNIRAVRSKISVSKWCQKFLRFHWAIFKCIFPLEHYLLPSAGISIVLQHFYLNFTRFHTLQPLKTWWLLAAPLWCKQLRVQPFCTVCIVHMITHTMQATSRPSLRTYLPTYLLDRGYCIPHNSNHCLLFRRWNACLTGLRSDDWLNQSKT